MRCATPAELRRGKLLMLARVAMLYRTHAGEMNSRGRALLAEAARRLWRDGRRLGIPAGQLRRALRAKPPPLIRVA